MHFPLIQKYKSKYSLRWNQQDIFWFLDSLNIVRFFFMSTFETVLTSQSVSSMTFWLRTSFEKCWRFFSLISCGSSWDKIPVEMDLDMNKCLPNEWKELTSLAYPISHLTDDESRLEAGEEDLSLGVVAGPGGALPVAEPLLIRPRVHHLMSLPGYWWTDWHPMWWYVCGNYVIMAEDEKWPGILPFALYYLILSSQLFQGPVTFTPVILTYYTYFRAGDIYWNGKIVLF